MKHLTVVLLIVASMLSIPRELRAAAGAEVIYAPPKERLDISFFYDSLAPYGTWRQDVRYGWVWRPAAAVSIRDWRPYCHAGHWVWTDCGWYWESDYPWGWAAFHYGRWHAHPEWGWVWVPDTVWGPAWVHWRSSADYYGWAPLPPTARFTAGVGFSFDGGRVGFGFSFGLRERDYAFVPSNSFLAVDVGAVVLPRTRVRNVFNQTTIVNNTYVYNDTRVINSGVPVKEVASRTRTRVEALKVTDMKVEAGTAITRAETRDKKKIVAFRPALAARAAEDPPTVLKRREAAAQGRQAGKAGETREAPLTADKERARRDGSTQRQHREEKEKSRVQERREKPAAEPRAEPRAREGKEAQPSPDERVKAERQVREEREKRQIQERREKPAAEPRAEPRAREEREARSARKEQAQAERRNGKDEEEQALEESATGRDERKPDAGARGEPRGGKPRGKHGR
jgi:hypothetical protein